MKKNLYLVTLAASFLFAQAELDAQCSGLRYRDYIFTDSIASNITYGSNVSSNNQTTTLKLDVHMPQGDTASARPLIVLAHGGNFLGGSKTGGDVLGLANSWAKMGYVVASIDYRVGMTNFPFPGPDSSDATEAVLRGVHDARAAVRFFRKDFATTNTYRIDTSNIFFAGVSAGGFMALHLAYLDDIAEFPSWADTINRPGLTGGIEGNSGNPGYPSNVRAVINICGALGDTAWIKPGDEPACLLHGDQDNTVPYGSAIIVLLGSYPLLYVDGSYSVNAKLDQLGIENCFETHEGQDHVPHVGNTLYFDTTLNISRNFLVHYICGDPLNCSYNNPIGMEEHAAVSDLVRVYPNPASTSVRLDLSRLASAPQQVRLFDASGRLVRTLTDNTSMQYDISTAGLPSGLYMFVINGENYYYSSPLQVTH
ncbi:MAG: Carboxylesterase type B [Bacteroidetes bacterium]|nr:MAG: Carboxylesterase type B [Bacteroidota bacterium]